MTEITTAFTILEKATNNQIVFLTLKYNCTLYIFPQTLKVCILTINKFTLLGKKRCFIISS